MWAFFYFNAIGHFKIIRTFMLPCVRRLSYLAVL